MRMCAYKQEHGPAAMYLGRVAKLDEDFAQALKYYQDGTRFGNKEAAAALMLFFRTENWNYFNAEHMRKLRELELKPDAERKARYKAVLEALELNPDLRLKRIDEVLPLPPSELPPWNGVQDAIEPETDAPPTY